MHKLNKIVSLITALLLVVSSLCSVAIAADAESTQPITALSELGDPAVERTNALGILNAYDLTLDSQEEITRAEFVVWTVKLLGLQPSTGTGVFQDVPADYWAADYINTAYELKLISDDAAFNPDQPIKHSEALKLLTVAAGYEPAAQENGGWPEGYMVMATRLGITNGVSASSDDTVTRIDAVRMIDNTLDANIMTSDYNGTYMQSNETVLSNYLGINVYDAEIKEVLRKEGEIRVDIDGREQVYTLSSQIDITLVVEDEVKLYVLNDRFEEKVVYIDYSGTITVEYDFISEVNERYSGEALTADGINTIYLRNADKEYKVDASGVVVTLNDVNAYDVPVVLCNAFAKVVLRDGKVIKIEAYSLYEGGIIKYAGPDMIKYIKGDVNDNVMQQLETIEDLRIYIDGKPTVNMYDLKLDMIFDYYINAAEDMMIIVASSRVFSKTLSSVSNDYLYLDNVAYEKSSHYGLYVYSNTRGRYQKDESLDSYLGKTVKVFVDDSGYVRYISISDDVENLGSFVGLVMSVSKSTSAFDENDVQLKIFKLTDGQGEKVYDVDSKRMEKSPVTVDYLRQYAGDAEGKCFFKFTVNKDNRITSVDPVDLWGNTRTFSGTISKTSTTYIGNLYARTATLFAAFNDPTNGEFTVKVLDFEGDLRDTTFPSTVTVISDYDPLYNPTPSFIMLGKGAEDHRSNGASRKIVESVVYLEDDKVQVKFSDEWGTNNYTLEKDFFDSTGLKEQMMVTIYQSLWTENPFRIDTKRDLTIDPDNWVTDNATYNSGVNTGFYRADQILYRDGEVAQFLVNGEATDVIPCNDYYTVYELIRTKSGNKLVRNKGVNPLGYINQTDNVWFSLASWGPGPRSVDLVIYEKTSVAGN